MIVTFCGHRQLPKLEQVNVWLNILLPAMMEGGADKFYLGGYGDFDLLAAKAVKAQKSRYPHIQSVLVLAYPKREFNNLIYDTSFYPELKNVKPGKEIVERNRFMVDNSDVVVAYVNRCVGGAACTLSYARQRKKVILKYPYIDTAVKDF